MPRYLLDTGCLIAAQTPEESHYAAAAELIELGSLGRVELFTATSVDYDYCSAAVEHLDALPLLLGEMEVSGTDERACDE